FEDFFDNNINEVNATDSPVPAVGQISTNSTNTFTDAALEDITYFDDEEDVGAEADFTNLETNITVSHIPTTRVHKDHHHDDKTKREAKCKSPVESLIGYRNLNAEFKDFSDNNINEDNDVGTLVPVVGQLSPNSTNTFSAVGPSNAAASPTHGKSSCIDTS
nr:hypothetical protein [Tanacetum cinerariifolium]